MGVELNSILTTILLKSDGTAAVAGQELTTPKLNPAALHGGTTGQVLTKTASTVAWQSPTDGLPSGAIIMWYGAAAPAGWKLCDGTNGTPDLRGRVPVGYGAGPNLTNRDTLGATGGAENHILTIEQMPGHNHGITEPNGGQGHRHPIPFAAGTDGGSGAFDDGGNPYNTGVVSSFATTGITINNTGGGQAHNNMQPFAVVNFIMKI